LKELGYRCIIIYRHEDKSFFVYGFPKSERDNINQDEVEVFKDLSEQMLNFSDLDLQKLMNSGALEEVNGYEQK
jgi:hypothetical protein